MASARLRSFFCCSFCAFVAAFAAFFLTRSTRWFFWRCVIRLSLLRTRLLRAFASASRRSRSTFLPLATATLSFHTLPRDTLILVNTAASGEIFVRQACADVACTRLRLVAVKPQVALSDSTLTVASSWRASRYTSAAAPVPSAPRHARRARRAPCRCSHPGGRERVVAQRSLLLERAVLAAGEFVAKLGRLDRAQAKRPAARRTHAYASACLPPLRHVHVVIRYTI
mmetsp:Transcript_25882/g.56746  ORF Transcript_25882/g.56746 Transcript_25882/m.56746 type:complete len:227 (-) Transcript_25882:359-1039(-)